MSRNVHLPFIVISTLSVSATLACLILQGNIEDVFTMLKVILPIFVVIVVMLHVATRRLQPDS